MNPNLCRIALRPRDPFEVFDLTLRFVREKWRPLLTLGAWVVLPWLVLTIPLCWAFSGHWGLLAMPVLIAGLVQAPFTMMSGRLLFADDVTVWDTMADLVRRGPTLIGVWLVSLLGWVAAVLTCGIVAPFAQSWLLYLGETALLERVPVSRSVRRSLRLAGAQMGVAMAGAAGRWFLTLWFGLLGELSGHTIVNIVLQLGEPFGNAWQGDVTPYLLAGLIVAQPVHAVYRLLLYVDIRTRVEGWDLQVALRAAGMGVAT